MMVEKRSAVGLILLMVVICSVGFINAAFAGMSGKVNPTNEVVFRQYLINQSVKKNNPNG